MANQIVTADDLLRAVCFFPNIINVHSFGLKANRPPRMISPALSAPPLGKVI
jgi:hypothetical protein